MFIPALKTWSSLRAVNPPGRKLDQVSLLYPLDKKINSSYNKIATQRKESGDIFTGMFDAICWM